MKTQISNLKSQIADVNFIRLPVTVALLAVQVLAAGSAPLGDTASRYRSGDSIEALQRLDSMVAGSVSDPRLRIETEQSLLRMLEPEATQEAKLFACQRLAVIGTAASLDALSRLLSSEETAGMACLALANFPIPHAGTVLRRALGQTTGNARLQIIAALGSRRDSPSVKLLGELARGEDRAAAAAAILALGRIGDASAQRALSNLRGSGPTNQVPALDEATLLAAEALETRGAERNAIKLYEDLIEPSHPDHVRAGALSALLRLTPSPEKAGKQILRILRREDPDLQPDVALRPVALAAVGTLRSRKTATTFGNELSKLAQDEQVLLIHSLADLGPDCPRAALAGQLGSDSGEVRSAVLGAFARLNDPVDLPILVRALGSAKSPAERRAVEIAIFQLPGGRATDQAILSLLAGRSPATQAGLLNALARRGSTDAIPSLFKASTSGEVVLASAGYQGLGRLAGPAELPAMLDTFGNLPPGPIRDAAEAALARILARIPDPNERSQAVCRKVRDASSPASRSALLRLLPFTGSPDALAVAQDALKNDDAGVRDAAVRALADWPAATAAPVLTVLYRESTDSTHRALALRGLVRLANDANQQPDGALVDQYRVLLEVAHADEDRKMILGALGGCGHPKALELALAQWEKPETREEAAQAVRRIADTIKAAHPEAAAAALKKLTPPP